MLGAWSIHSRVRCMFNKHDKVSTTCARPSRQIIKSEREKDRERRTYWYVDMRIKYINTWHSYRPASCKVTPRITRFQSRFECFIMNRLSAECVVAPTVNSCLSFRLIQVTWNNELLWSVFFFLFLFIAQKIYAHTTGISKYIYTAVAGCWRAQLAQFMTAHSRHNGKIMKKHAARAFPSSKWAKGSSVWRFCGCVQFSLYISFLLCIYILVFFFSNKPRVLVYRLQQFLSVWQDISCEMKPFP